MDPLELDLNNPDAQLTLYEDVLIRKKSMESLNSIVPKDDENWNDFNRINNNNSFVIDNPEPEPKQDKEMLPDAEMQGNSPTTLASLDDRVEDDFNMKEGSKKQESI